MATTGINVCQFMAREPSICAQFQTNSRSSDGHMCHVFDNSKRMYARTFRRMNLIVLLLFQWECMRIVCYNHFYSCYVNVWASHRSSSRVLAALVSNTQLHQHSNHSPTLTGKLLHGHYGGQCTAQTFVKHS
jgi:hypothetical protein